MKKADIYNTHIEVYPYDIGEYDDLEKSLSKWDQTYFRRVPIAYYIEDETLYIPRGVGTMEIENFFDDIEVTKVNVVDKSSKIRFGEPLYEPKSSIQEKAIDFLTGENDYKDSLRYAQLGLNLDTGDGKTYAAISAILKLKEKAIIITHQTKIKNQWIKSIKDMTTFPNDRLIDICGSDDITAILDGYLSGEIYVVNHQTIHSYARENGWQSITEFFRTIKVGIKVIDEAHKFFENSLMIDYFTNTKKTFYLTATYGRSDSKEQAIYRRAFSSLARFGEETFDYEEKRKHIKFIICYFSSKSSNGYEPNVRTAYGFSGYKYIDYQLTEDNNTLMKVTHKILDNISHLKGKILIISTKTESCEIIAEDVAAYTGKSVGTIHSKNSPEKNADSMTKEIISSTVKSIGEGVDIKGLRALILLEPIGSKSLADQVRGRLREYSSSDDTFLFYPVDLTIPDMTVMLKRIRPMMKRKCKEIVELHF